MKWVIGLFLIVSCGQQVTRVQDPYNPDENIVDGVNLNQEYEGVDINGQPLRCTPMPEDRICTGVFTPGDQYAQDCEKLGGVAIECSCHNWICVR